MEHSKLKPEDHKPLRQSIYRVDNLELKQLKEFSLGLILVLEKKVSSSDKLQMCCMFAIYYDYSFIK